MPPGIILTDDQRGRERQLRDSTRRGNTLDDTQERMRERRRGGQRRFDRQTDSWLEQARERGRASRGGHSPRGPSGAPRGSLPRVGRSPITRDTQLEVRNDRGEGGRGQESLFLVTVGGTSESEGEAAETRAQPPGTGGNTRSCRLGSWLGLGAKCVDRRCSSSPSKCYPGTDTEWYPRRMWWGDRGVDG